MRLARGLAALALAGTLALGACGPTPTPTPIPGPVPRVAVTPAFAPRVLGWAQTYLEEVGPLPFDLEVVHAAAALKGLGRGDYVLAIGALEPEDGWFATPLASDPIAVVTGSQAGLRQVTRGALVDLLAGRVLNWSALGGGNQPVQPVIPLPDDDLRRMLDEKLMLGMPFASNARLIAAPGQALALVDQDPGAVALLPLSALPAGAVPLRLDGVLPVQEGALADGYELIATINAVAPSEPHGSVRDWLAWLQASHLP